MLTRGLTSQKENIWHFALLTLNQHIQERPQPEWRLASGQGQLCKKVDRSYLTGLRVYICPFFLYYI
jgi:hypothetical protein